RASCVVISAAIGARVSPGSDLPEFSGHQHNLSRKRFVSAGRPQWLSGMEAPGRRAGGATVRVILGAIEELPFSDTDHTTRLRTGLVRDSRMDGSAAFDCPEGRWDPTGSQVRVL